MILPIQTASTPHAPVKSFNPVIQMPLPRHGFNWTCCFKQAAFLLHRKNVIELRDWQVPANATKFHHANVRRY
jgi:hypothetical protein